MSFQGYLKTIKEKTGLNPQDFKDKAEEKNYMAKGQLSPDIKAGDIVAWLKDEYDLGHGHSMAIYAILKGLKNENSQ